MTSVYSIQNVDRDYGVSYILKHHYGCVPTIIKDERGKPYFETITDGISISHDGKYLVVAISKQDVGVDIQQKQYRSLIAERYFANNEKELDERTFTRLWTLKESYSKYVGTGLNKEILKKDFSSFLDSDCFVYENLVFHLFEVEDYVIAICTNDDTINYVCLGGL